MKATIDEVATSGMTGLPYDWSNFNELTYSAWLVGRRLAGKTPLKEIKVTQDGAAAKVSLHPANWR